MSDYITETWPINTHTHTHTHPFNSPLYGTTQVSRYQKGKTNLDFTGAKDSERQWYQLDCMQVCNSLQTNNHASTSLLNVLQAGCPSCRPTKVSKHWRPINKAIIYLINLFATSAYRIITGVKRLDKEHVTAFQSQLQNFFGHLILLEYST